MIIVVFREKNSFLLESKRTTFFFKNYNNQSYSCAVDQGLLASWGSGGMVPKGLRGPLIRSPLCKETRASQTADVNFSSLVNPFMPTVAFNICCPRDCVSRHNGSTAGVPLKPLRDDSALRALSSLRGLRGAPEVPETIVL